MVINRIIIESQSYLRELESMMDIFENIGKSFESFRNMVKEIPDKYNQNEKDIERLQQETQDLLHLLEFTPISARDGYKISKQLQEIRRERRKLKDENRLLEPLAPLMKRYRNELGNMDKVLDKVQKRSKQQDMRVYKCRVRTDLQESVDNKKIVNL